MEMHVCECRKEEDKMKKKTHSVGGVLSSSMWTTLLIISILPKNYPLVMGYQMAYDHVIRRDQWDCRRTRMESCIMGAGSSTTLVTFVIFAIWDQKNFSFQKSPITSLFVHFCQLGHLVWKESRVCEKKVRITSLVIIFSHFTRELYRFFTNVSTLDW